MATTTTTADTNNTTIPQQSQLDDSESKKLYKDIFIFIRESYFPRYAVYQV